MPSAQTLFDLPGVFSRDEVSRAEIEMGVRAGIVSRKPGTKSPSEPRFQFSAGSATLAVVAIATTLLAGAIPGGLTTCETSGSVDSRRESDTHAARDPVVQGGGASVGDPLNSAERYINSLAEEPNAFVSKSTAHIGLDLLTFVVQSVRGAPVPTIAPGPDGMLGMTWQNAKGHFNVEIFSDEHVELFYEDMSTGKFREREGSVLDLKVEIADAVADLVREFA